MIVILLRRIRITHTHLKRKWTWRGDDNTSKLNERYERGGAQCQSLHRGVASVLGVAPVSELLYTFRVVMKSPKSRKPLFERLKTGLEEGIRHAKGVVILQTTTLEVPHPSPEDRAEEVTEIRLGSEMSHAIFARMLKFSTKTVSIPLPRLNASW